MEREIPKIQIESKEDVFYVQKSVKNFVYTAVKKHFESINDEYDDNNYKDYLDKNVSMIIDKV